MSAQVDSQKKAVADNNRFWSGGPADTGGRLTGDGGLALPLIALMMIVLLAFVAFAVDIGAAFAVRRQSQSAADSAVIGAALEMRDTDFTQLTVAEARAKSGAYAKKLSRETVALDPSASGWDAAYATCADSQQLAVTAPGGTVAGVWTTGGAATACVSFSANNQRVRVRIPTQDVDASFARLVGFDTFNISTSAEAVINFTPAAGGALPYAITGIGAELQEVCLNNGAGNVDVELCSGGETGNFGALDWSLYGNTAALAWDASGQTTLSLPTSCSDSSDVLKAIDRLAINDMLGVDHPLSVLKELGNSGNYDPTDIRDDRAICQASTPPNWLARPNVVWTQTGNAIAKGTSEGLINGKVWNGVTLRGRLDRYCGLGMGWDCENLHTNGTNARNAGGSPVDDTPLWEFLATDLVVGPPGTSSRADGSFRSVPASCLPSAFASTPTKTQLLACFTDYNNGPDGNPATPADSYVNTVDANGDKGTVLFNKDSDGDSLNGLWDIMAAPRFGFVPLLWDQTFVPGQSDPVKIREFRPVYFQTMYLGCNSGTGCDQYNPGQSWPGVPQNKSLDAISAMAIRLSMLPVEARDFAPDADQDLRITLVR